MQVIVYMPRTLEDGFFNGPLVQLKGVSIPFCHVHGIGEADALAHAQNVRDNFHHFKDCELTGKELAEAFELCKDTHDKFEFTLEDK